MEQSRIEVGKTYQEIGHNASKHRRHVEVITNLGEPEKSVIEYTAPAPAWLSWLYGFFSGGKKLQLRHTTKAWRFAAWADICIEDEAAERTRQEAETRAAIGKIQEAVHSGIQGWPGGWPEGSSGISGFSGWPSNARGSGFIAHSGWEPAWGRGTEFIPIISVLVKRAGGSTEISRAELQAVPRKITITHLPNGDIRILTREIEPSHDIGLVER